MRKRSQSWIVLLVVVFLAASPGCRRETAPVKPGQPGAGTQGPATQGGESVTGEPVPPPPTIPKVKLSAAQRATCLVQVGDVMPDAELVDLAGQKHALKGLLGKSLMVVAFWTAGGEPTRQLRAVEMLESLATDVAQPFAAKGVQAIGVNEGDTPQVVGQSIEQAGARFPNFLDPDRALLAKVATEKLPRVYLLDAQGKILWFDLEYSRTTRRDLLEAIRAVVGEAAQK